MKKVSKGGRGRTRRVVQQSAKRPRWNSNEIALLKRLYRTHSNAEIAEELGRSVSSIVFKAYRLGLSKGIRRLREMGRENVARRWHPEGGKSKSTRHES